MDITLSGRLPDSLATKPAARCAAVPGSIRGRSPPPPAPFPRAGADCSRVSGSFAESGSSGAPGRSASLSTSSSPRDGPPPALCVWRRLGAFGSPSAICFSLGREKSTAPVHQPLEQLVLDLGALLLGQFSGPSCLVDLLQLGADARRVVVLLLGLLQDLLGQPHDATYGQQWQAEQPGHQSHSLCLRNEVVRCHGPEKPQADTTGELLANPLHRVLELLLTIPLDQERDVDHFLRRGELVGHGRYGERLEPLH